MLGLMTVRFGLVRHGYFNRWLKQSIGRGEIIRRFIFIIKNYKKRSFQNCLYLLNSFGLLFDTQNL